MLSNDCQMTSNPGYYKGYQLCKLAVTDDCHIRRRVDADLFQNVAGRSEGLREHCRIVANLIRHCDHIANGKGKELAKRSVTILDPQYCAFRTVPGITGLTQLTQPASGVDFSHDACPDQRRVRRLCHAANKLVPECSAECRITLHDFQIRVADAGRYHFHESFIGSPRNCSIHHEF